MTTHTLTNWQIAGADGQAILGNTHQPDGPAAGTVLIAHGFKGYKDYGMFPAVASAFAAGGFVAHRFNFSHSGMTERLDTFERADLFERDTWNRQVTDLLAVAAAVGDGTIAGGGVPLLLLGHSRGGVSVLLAAGRHGGDPSLASLAGVITVAAPSACSSLTDDQAATLLEKGFIISPSSRTKQDLRVGRAFLQEQLDDAAGHDLLARVAMITVPMLIVHGESDETVPASSAKAIAGAAKRGRTLIIPGGDHVMNTPNPFPADGEKSPQLARMIDAAVEFARAQV